MRCRSILHDPPFRLAAACLASALLLAGTAAAEGDASLWEYTPEDLANMRLTNMDHSLDEGEFLVGYQFMHMEMRGNRDGTNDLDRRDFFDQTGYMVRPRWMTMQMHMIHLMYSPKQDWTLMLMLPFVKLKMDHQLRMPMMGRRHFVTRNDGVGDIEVTLLHTVFEDDLQRIILKGGVGIPSGAIGKKTSTPMGRVRFPYPMRLGSGTVSLSPGATYSLETEHWNLGADIEGTFQLAENKYNYRLGPRGEIDAWVMGRVAKWFALSVRAQGSVWGNIHGRDKTLNPAMVPTADPDRRAGAQVTLLGGLNFIIDSGPLKGNRLVLEAGHPVYEWLDGPQLRTRWQTKLDWSFTF